MNIELAGAVTTDLEQLWHAALKRMESHRGGPELLATIKGDVTSEDLLPSLVREGAVWTIGDDVDLAGFAGAVFATTIELCSRTSTLGGENSRVHCADASATLNSRTARFSLVGAGLGLLAGWMLTMNYDRPRDTRPELPPLSFIPLPGAVPVESMTGTPELLPGLLSQGRF